MNPNKYEQAMERVVERDNRIKLLSERAKSFTSENVELKQLYDKVLQQNHVIENTLARNEIEFSNLHGKQGDAWKYSTPNGDT